MALEIIGLSDGTNGFRSDDSSVRISHNSGRKCCGSCSCSDCPASSVSRPAVHSSSALRLSRYSIGRVTGDAVPFYLGIRYAGHDSADDPANPSSFRPVSGWDLYND